MYYFYCAAKNFPPFTFHSIQRYSEGYPGARYYGGNENIDKASSSGIISTQKEKESKRK